ncbi:cellulose biosynthesis cyclic di-GMP-binding regulatory protein BcsB [Orrella sp. JC864]|uniref:cellulose biosynthesis cyclic di-GMP-binding regulatory protein BcsB n=1 Tax=Orrella sp. JC864 TaxID=3120298 RepID=UPI00300968E9
MTSKVDAPLFPSMRQRLGSALAAALLGMAGAHAQPAPGEPSLPADIPPAPLGAPALPADTALPGPPGPLLPYGLQPQPEPLPGTRTYPITLHELGARNGLALRGVDGRQGVPLSIRSDERLVGARLKLEYGYSPALLPELSHIKVLLNDELAASIALPQEDAGAPATHEVELPAGAFVDFNRLETQLIGHYTLRCEDPVHSSLWADVSSRSAVELTVEPLELPNNLALLPRPFFDERDPRALALPIVLPGALDTSRLESAGIIASWFGALASYRGARFPVSEGRVPEQGHAVVILGRDDTLAGLPPLPPVTGPTLSMVQNPNDRYGKLLLVMGRDGDEIKQAARALALASRTLSGQTALVTGLSEPAPRRPFDAPNWLRTDRPVRFGELASEQALNAAGHRPGPIQLDLRLPPGLFGWRSEGVPVELKYRYTPRPGAEQSTLQVMAGHQLLRALPLTSASQAQAYSKVLGVPASQASASLRVPTYLLPALASLQFQYVYEYAKLGECQNSIIDNVRSAIDPDSTIDISGIPLYAAMPDLAAFGEAGFPFTRMADLSETAVILPENPSADDYSAYLDLMGLMGESTGYPATHVTVAQAGQIEQLRRKDLLVLASGDNQPLLAQWRDRLPGSFAANDKRFSLASWMARAFGGDDPRERRAPADQRIEFSSSGASAIFAGLESPLSSGRSVVVVSANQPQGLPAAVAAVQQARHRDDKLRGSLAVVRGERIDSLAAEQTYYVGSLPFWTALQWFFAGRPLLLVLIAFAGAVILGALLYLSLRARAQRRLRD